MTPYEVAHRTRRWVATQVERRDFKTGHFDWPEPIWRGRLCKHAAEPPEVPHLSQWWLNHMRARREPPFLLDLAGLDDAAALYRTLFADRLDATVDYAERVSRGEFAFLGISFRAADPIAWQSDPLTRRPWPKTFYADIEIPFCAGFDGERAPGDIKHVWELNRHEFLIQIAKAYWLTRESRHAARVLKWMQSWAAENRYLQGVNWAGPLEVAVRALSWLWSYQLVRSWEEISADVHLEIIKTLYQHGFYLHRHLEYFTSPNNHLIGEAAALYALGCFFPEFNESIQWRCRGWRVLEEYLDQQFYDDGGSTEQATFYHNYCLGFFLIALLIRQKRNEPVIPLMGKRLERALEFTMWMTRGDGTVPRIGDADDSRSIRFSNHSLWDFRNLLCLGAILFRRADLKAVAGSFSEDALWLTGEAGYGLYQGLEACPPDQTVYIFPQSGYCAMRSGWGREDDHLVFDFGQIAGGLHTRDVPSSAHGHADMLSVNVTVGGNPLLVDGGFFTFNGDPAWHHYFRESAAHNTIRVNGASQAKFNPSNGWSRVAVPQKASWGSTGDLDYVECSHAGFYHLRTKVRHRRAVCWVRKAYWVIVDRLEGEGEHFVEAFFHIAPGRAFPETGSPRVLIETVAGVRALLHHLDRKGFQLEVLGGGNEPADGWIGTSYGCRERAPVLRYYGSVQLPASLVFALVPFDRDKQVPVVESCNLVVSQDQQSITCTVLGDSLADQFEFRWDTDLPPKSRSCHPTERIRLYRKPLCGSRSL